MHKIKVKTVEELAGQVQAMKETHLFRGQHLDYGTGGKPQFMPSIRRLGCIPSQMQRWSWIAREVLYALNVDEDLITGKGTEYGQAMMQHYGWRSFFLDLSECPHVGSWFAGNSIIRRGSGRMAEDANEHPVILRFDECHKEEPQGEGHLFCFPTSELSQTGRLINLQSSNMLRPQRQKAWMLGLDQGVALDGKCSGETHISGPAEVFREYANLDADCTFPGLFPGLGEDYLYRVLVFWPWRFVAKAGGLPMFGHELGLPTYKVSSNENPWNIENLWHLPDEVAFMENCWFGEHIAKEGTIQLQVDSSMYATMNQSSERSIPQVLGILKRSPGKRIVIETDALVRRMDKLFGTEYAKGIVVQESGPSEIAVSEISVFFKGRELHSVGEYGALHYRVNEDGQVVERIIKKEDCPCEDGRGHRSHLEFLAHVDGCWDSSTAKEVSKGVYRMAPILQQSIRPWLNDV